MWTGIEGQGRVGGESSGGPAINRAKGARSGRPPPFSGPGPAVLLEPLRFPQTTSSRLTRVGLCSGEALQSRLFSEAPPSPPPSLLPPPPPLPPFPPWSGADNVITLHSWMGKRFEGQGDALKSLFRQEGVDIEKLEYVDPDKQ